MLDVSRRVRIRRTAVWARRVERPVFVGTPRSVSALAICWNAEPPERIEQRRATFPAGEGLAARDARVGDDERQSDQPEQYTDDHAATVFALPL